jgi:hypothetical protein
VTLIPILIQCPALLPIQSVQWVRNSSLSVNLDRLATVDGKFFGLSFLLASEIRPYHTSPYRPADQLTVAIEKCRDQVVVQNSNVG